MSEFDASASRSAPIAFACPAPLPPGDQVLLGHGSGGRLSADLVRSLFHPAFGDPELARLGDAAVVDVEGTRLAFTTDGFVVQPAFFPGSDIGALAVNGTVNDLAVMGARPAFLSAAFILEEGFPTDDLGRIAESMGAACTTAGIRLVAADTKVVERGGADGIFIVTSGIGTLPEGVHLGPEHIEDGDVVIVSGPVGDHGVAVMSRRAGIDFEVDVGSDTAPLTELVDVMRTAGSVHCLRDATRGGVATVLNELAASAGVTITIDDEAVPVQDPVRAACETLGIDPLYVANEGVCVAMVGSDSSDAVVAAAREHPIGRQAVAIGRVESGPAAVHLRTGLGVTRPLLMLTADQLPRIC
ncbi:MAG: hydrogenase expression/formation protein HypE [Acidimicrobiia bacterium]|nr:hydrogenase expression/formation protein HypE [Acidimicrobiia bacterium]